MRHRALLLSCLLLAVCGCDGMETTSDVLATPKIKASAAPSNETVLPAGSDVSDKVEATLTLSHTGTGPDLKYNNALRVVNNTKQLVDVTLEFKVSNETGGELHYRTSTVELKTQQYRLAGLAEKNEAFYAEIGPRFLLSKKAVIVN